jgi:hypothetical protein
MAYYRTCPVCKASLDPQERCDCQDYNQAGQKEPAVTYSLLNNKGTQRNIHSGWIETAMHRRAKASR